MALSDLLEKAGLWNTLPPGNTLARNYLTYGALMGFAGYDEFVRRARSFFDEAMTACQQEKPLYTRVNLENGRVAFDYNAQVRGIYTANGKPLAFFRPNYKTAGFASAEEELEVFRTSFEVKLKR